MKVNKLKGVRYFIVDIFCVVGFATLYDIKVTPDWPTLASLFVGIGMAFLGIVALLSTIEMIAILIGHPLLQDDKPTSL